LRIDRVNYILGQADSFELNTALVLQPKAFLLGWYLEVSLELEVCYTIDSPFSGCRYVRISAQISHKIDHG
jgi:hypothetical protein